MMADAVAGGDTKKLFKMMERGELDPNKHLPLLWEAMGKSAAPFMDEFFKSIRFARGSIASSGERWFKSFMEKGATQGLTDLYSAFATVMEDAEGSAGFLGNTFYRVSNAGVAAIMGFQELKEYLSGTGREYENIFRDMFGDFVGLGNFLKMTEFKEIGESFSTLKTQISDFSVALTPVVNALRKEFGKGTEGAIGDTATFAKDVVVGTMDQISGTLDWLNPLIKKDDSFLDSAMRAWAREKTKRVASEILTAEGIDPRTFSSEERRKMEEELYPEILKTLQSQREAMGEFGFKAFLHDTGMLLTGNPLVTQIESSALYLNERLADLMNIFVKNITYDRLNLDSVQQATRRRPMTLETAKFLRDNPHLIKYELPIVQGKPFDKDVIEWNKVAEEVNNLLRSRLQDTDLTRFPSAAYQDGQPTVNQSLNHMSPYKDLRQTGHRFSVPTMEKPILMRLSEESILDLRSSLTPLTSGAIVQDSPEQVIPQRSVFNTNNITPTVNLTATYNIEVSDTDNFVAAIEENNEVLMIAIANEIGGLA